MLESPIGMCLIGGKRERNKWKQIENRVALCNIESQLNRSASRLSSDFDFLCAIVKKEMQIEVEESLTFFKVICLVLILEN